MEGKCHLLRLQDYCAIPSAAFFPNSPSYNLGTVTVIPEVSGANKAVQATKLGAGSVTVLSTINLTEMEHISESDEGRKIDQPPLLAFFEPRRRS